MPVEHFTTALQRDEEGRSIFIEVPAAVIAALGTRRRPPVRATLNGYEYRTTIAVYGGRYYLPVRREIREAAGLAPGTAVAVDLTLDEEPGEIALPEEFAQTLAADPEAGAAFARLPYGHRREFVGWIGEAKRAETRRRRAEKAVAMLREGRQEP